MGPASLELTMDLKNRLGSVPYEERGKLVSLAAKAMSCSVSTIYRRLKAVGWTSERKIRSDCGKTEVPEELARLATGMVSVATRKTGKQTLPLTVACDILKKNGMGVINPDTGEVTMPHPATIARAARRYGCHPDQLNRAAPARELKSLYPNHVWQMDASTCVLFYLPSGRVRTLDEAKYYKNKPSALRAIEKMRVTRYVITDHYSGALFVRYALGEEDALGVLDTLIQAMCRRENGDELRGVPEILMTDKGAGNCSALVQGFLKRLGIRHITHATGNARAKGQAEVHQNIVERLFEGRLRMMDVESIEALNSAVSKWRVYFNSHQILSRTGQTRNSVWMTIPEDKLRVPVNAEALRELAAAEPKKARVSQRMTVSYASKATGGRHDYDVRYIPGISIRDMVEVSVNPWRAPAVDICMTLPDGERKVWTVDPIERDSGGFRVDAPVIGENHAALPDTVADRQIKAMHKDAYGDTPEGKDREKVQGRAYTQIDAMADVEADKAPLYFPKRGRELKTEETRPELPPLSHVEAAKQLAARYPDIWHTDPAKHMCWLKQRYPESVPVQALDELGEALEREREGHAAEPLKLIRGPLNRAVG